jgi:hypothetical protein
MQRFREQRRMFGIERDEQGWVQCRDAMVREGLLAMQFAQIWRFRYLERLKKVGSAEEMARYLRGAAEQSRGQ